MMLILLAAQQPHHLHKLISDKNVKKTLICDIKRFDTVSINDFLPKKNKKSVLFVIKALFINILLMFCQVL